MTDVKGRIVALFHWGVEQGLMGPNPVHGIRKPRAKSRGSQAVLGPPDDPVNPNHNPTLESTPHRLKRTR
jgi:hypothetical protein